MVVFRRNICGIDKPEDGICLDCLASIVHTDSIFPNESDFECS